MSDNNVVGGFEAFVERGLNTTGGFEYRRGDNEQRIKAGPMKGKTRGEAYNWMRDRYSKMSDSAKAKYENESSGNDVRSQREIDAIGKANDPNYRSEKDKENNFIVDSSGRMFSGPAGGIKGKVPDAQPQNQFNAPISPPQPKGNQPSLMDKAGGYVKNVAGKVLSNVKNALSPESNIKQASGNRDFKAAIATPAPKTPFLQRDTDSQLSAAKAAHAALATLQDGGIESLSQEEQQDYDAKKALALISNPPQVQDGSKKGINPEGKMDQLKSRNTNSAPTASYQPMQSRMNRRSSMEAPTQFSTRIDMKPRPLKPRSLGSSYDANAITA